MTTTRKLQLIQELSNVRLRDMSVADYTSVVVVVVDEVGRHAMEAANRNRTRGITIMPPKVSDLS